MKKNMQYITHFTEKMKNYCAREERAKSDVIKKMDLLGLSNENQQYIIDVLLNENYLNEKRFSQSFKGAHIPPTTNYSQTRLSRLFISRHLTSYMQR